MDLYYGLSDQTASSASSDSSWIDDSIRRRRLSSASPSTFLAPAFSACAATQSTSPLDLDSSLIRFTRPRPRCDSPDSAGSARGRLRKLLQLRSPLRSVENLPRTPVKLVGVGEDVLVMDGVLVSDAAEPPRNKPGSGESGSSGLASSSGSNSAKSSLYKTEMCRSWEDTGLCRYGSKCQFAHGKEELRGPRLIKPKSDMGGQCSKSAPKFRSHLRLGIAAPVPKRTTGSYALPHMGSTIRRAEEAPARTPSPPSEPSTAFVWPPTEEEDAYFARVLYAPSARKRLPVFVEFCPE